MSLSLPVPAPFAIAESLGLARSVSLNPEHKYARCSSRARLGAGHLRQGNRQSDRAGLGGAMMLDHLGQAVAAEENVSAIAKLLATRNAPKPSDLAGNAKTQDLAKALVEQFI